MTDSGLGRIAALAAARGQCEIQAGQGNKRSKRIKGVHKSRVSERVE